MESIPVGISPESADKQMHNIFSAAPTHDDARAAYEDSHGGDAIGLATSGGKPAERVQQPQKTQSCEQAITPFRMKGTDPEALAENLDAYAPSALASFSEVDNGQANNENDHDDDGGKDDEVNDDDGKEHGIPDLAGHDDNSENEEDDSDEVEAEDEDDDELCDSSKDIILMIHSNMHETICLIHILKCERTSTIIKHIRIWQSITTHVI